MIDIFLNDNFYLSNFYESPVQMDGYIYATVEHAFQAAKTMYLDERKQISECSTPGKAKRLGRTVHMREDWESIKYDTMRSLVLQKFLNNPVIRKKLLDTNEEILIEGNNWGDKIWGQVKNSEGVYEGQNLLGKVLTSVREELKNSNLKEI